LLWKRARKRGSDSRFTTYSPTRLRSCGRKSATASSIGGIGISDTTCRSSRTRLPDRRQRLVFSGSAYLASIPAARQAATKKAVRERQLARRSCQTSATVRVRELS